MESPGSAKPVVFVVDDDAAMRASLQRLLESVQLPVQTFASAAEFRERYDPEQPGCLLLDIRMPGMSGLELQDALQAARLRIAIIVITGHADVAVAVRAMKHGAVNFVEKPFSPELLIEQVREALALDQQWREADAEHNDAVKRLSALSKRERQVFELYVAGLSSKEIASRLEVSHKTVQTHRARIFRKTRVDSLIGLARLALTAK